MSSLIHFVLRSKDDDLEWFIKQLRHNKIDIFIHPIADSELKKLMAEAIQNKFENLKRIMKLVVSING